MRVVKLLDIVLSYVLMLLFAAALVAGVFKWPFFIAAAVLLGMYFLWEYFRLRCPWCRSAVEPSHLLRGLRRPCHCPSCGHEITVVVKVNNGPIKPYARTLISKVDQTFGAAGSEPDTSAEGPIADDVPEQPQAEHPSESTDAGGYADAPEPAAEKPGELFAADEAADAPEPFDAGVVTDVPEQGAADAPEPPIGDGSNEAEELPDPDRDAEELELLVESARATHKRPELFDAEKDEDSDPRRQQ